MAERFDVIVVGAGPAGCAAALVAARAGLSVLLLERGESPGSKNMFGGILYGPVLNDLVPNFWEEAPVERHITRRAISFLTPEASFSLDFKDQAFGQPPYNGFSILRSRFDRWLAGKAQEAGALLITEALVEEVLREGEQAIGVRVQREAGEVYGKVVILADGVNSLLARKAGLRREFSPEELSIGVKEVIQLPREVIEARFNLKGNEGTACELVGSCTQGVVGGGFLYTNRTSLSLGVVLQLRSMLERKLRPFELLEGFKGHPLVRDLIQGGSTREYLAHLIPEAGYRGVSELYSGGLLIAGDAAGLVCARGITLEGANFALASGILAGETAQEAHEKKDFSRQALASYRSRLESAFVLKDLKTFRRSPDFLSNPRLYQDYPELICGFAHRLFSVTGEPKEKAFKLFKEEVGKEASLWQLMKDGLWASRSM